MILSCLLERTPRPLQRARGDCNLLLVYDWTDPWYSEPRSRNIDSQILSPSNPNPEPVVEPLATLNYAPATSRLQTGLSKKLHMATISSSLLQNEHMPVRELYSTLLQDEHFPAVEEVDGMCGPSLGSYCGLRFVAWDSVGLQ